MSSQSEHGEHCTNRNSKACRAFSTDGTRLGSDIAHMFGTTDEREIAFRRIPEEERDFPLTGMDEEQADWEEGLDDNEAGQGGGD